jgi:hypothetical protein
MRILRIWGIVLACAGCGEQSDARVEPGGPAPTGAPADMGEGLIATPAPQAYHGMRMPPVIPQVGHSGPSPLACPTSNPPPPAQLYYYGGPIIANPKIFVLFWNSTVSSSLDITKVKNFFADITISPLFDWLAEYNTPTQTFGYGTMIGSYVASQTTTNVTDAQVQTALEALINPASGTSNLPAPDANTIYFIFFPKGMTITDSGGSISCAAGSFCAYHSAYVGAGANDAGKVVYYGIMPSFDPGTGCESCGSGITPPPGGGLDGGCPPQVDELDNTTIVASHELVEAMTDGQLPLAVEPVTNSNYLGAPIGWLDPLLSEIGDICAYTTNSTQRIHGTNTPPDRSGWAVQAQWSNRTNSCIASVPACTPNCAGKTCGSDGCYGFCARAQWPPGSCGACQTCSAGGTCTPITSAIDPNHCAGSYSCDATGTCHDNNAYCSSNALEFLSTTDGNATPPDKYIFWWIWLPASYKLNAGDRLAYDVFLNPGQTEVGTAELVVKVSATQNYLMGTVDQNGIPDDGIGGDLTGRAGGKWYHREMAPYTSLVGKTVDGVVLINQRNGVSVSGDAYFDNVAIVSSTGAVRTSIYQNGAPSASSSAGSAGYNTPTVSAVSDPLCPTACTSNANCDSADFCCLTGMPCFSVIANQNVCIPKQQNGSACSAANQCSYGFCAQGVCCNNACTGACAACNLAGSLGTCSPALGQGTPACANGYACNGSSQSCPTSCSGDAGCQGGFYCAGGVCTAQGGVGQSCTANDQCLSGICNVTCQPGEPDWQSLSSVGNVTPAANTTIGTVDLSVFATDNLLNALNDDAGGAQLAGGPLALPRTVENFPPVVPLADGKNYAIVTSQNGFLYKVRIDPTLSPAMAVVDSRDFRRAGCPGDTLRAAPAIQIAAYSTGFGTKDLVYVSTSHCQSLDPTNCPASCLTTSPFDTQPKNQVIAVDAANLATTVWTFSPPGGMGYGSDECTVDYASNQVYCGTDQPTGATLPTVWAVPTTGAGTFTAPSWSKQLGSVHNHPQLGTRSPTTCALDHLYVGDMSGNLTALDLNASGTQVWQVAIGAFIANNVWAETRGAAPSPCGTPSAGYRDAVYVTDGSGGVSVVQDNGASGTRSVFTGLAAHAVSPVTLDPTTTKPGGKGWVGLDDGTVAQLNLDTLAVEKSYLVAHAGAPTAGNPVTEPTLALISTNLKMIISSSGNFGTATKQLVVPLP